MLARNANRPSDKIHHRLRPAADLRTEQVILSSQYDPLAQVLGKAGTTVSTNAATLNRVISSLPARARQSLFQFQRQYGNRFMQRVLALDRKGEREAEAGPEVEYAIRRARRGGQALDSGVQGAYNSSSSSEQKLLAHELTHVVQQTGVKAQPKLVVNSPGDRYENEADQVARAVAHRQTKERPSRSPISQPARKNQQRSSLQTKTALLVQPAQARTKQAGIKIVDVRGAFLYFNRPITKKQAFEFLFGPATQKSTPELVDVFNNWERDGDDPSNCYYFEPKAVIPKTQGGTGTRYTSPMEVFAMAYAKTMTEEAKYAIQELGKVPMLRQPFVVRAQPKDIRAAREKEKPFKDRNERYLGENGAEQVFQALAAVVGDNIHLWGEFYDHYSKKDLRKISHKSLQSRPDQEVWAETKDGNTKVSDRLFSEDQDKFLGQILIHELAHRHHPEGMQRVMEPESLAVEYFFGKRAGGPKERLEYIESLMKGQGAWKPLFRRVFLTLRYLHDPKGAPQNAPPELKELKADEVRQMVALMVTEGTRLTILGKKTPKNEAERRLIVIWDWVLKYWRDLASPL